MDIRKVSHLPVIDISINKIYILDRSNEYDDDISRFVKDSIKNNDAIEYNDSLFIGFEYVNTQNYFSFEVDDKHSLVSLTYISNQSTPVYITKIDKPKYTYKQYKSEDELFVSFPEKNVQLTFKSRLNVISNSPIDMLIIYLFDKKPIKSKTYFVNSLKCCNIDFTYFNQDKYKDINVDGLLCFDFFNKLLYERVNKPNILIENLYTCDTQCKVFNLIETCKYTNKSELFNKNLTEMISGNPKTNNRFINRHKIDKKINTLICDYLYENVMTNENITNNQSVNKLIQFLLNKEIIPEITVNYNVPNNQIIGLHSININSFTSTQYKNLYENNMKEKSQIIVDLMLTDRSDYVGYSHEFNDESKVFLNKGDLIMYFKNSVVKNRILEKGQIVLLTFSFSIQQYNTMSIEDTYEKKIEKKIVY